MQKAAQLLPQSFWSPDEARPKAKNVHQRPAQANVKHEDELLAVRSLRGVPWTEAGPLLRAPSSEIVLFLEKQSSIPLVKKGQVSTPNTGRGAGLLPGLVPPQSQLWGIIYMNAHEPATHTMTEPHPPSREDVRQVEQEKETM